MYPCRPIVLYSCANVRCIVVRVVQSFPKLAVNFLVFATPLAQLVREVAHCLAIISRPVKALRRATVIEIARRARRYGGVSRSGRGAVD